MIRSRAYLFLTLFCTLCATYTLHPQQDDAPSTSKSSLWQRTYSYLGKLVSTVIVYVDITDPQSYTSAMRKQELLKNPCHHEGINDAARYLLLHMTHISDLIERQKKCPKHRHAAYTSACNFSCNTLTTALRGIVHAKNPQTWHLFQTVVQPELTPQRYEQLKALIAAMNSNGNTLSAATLSTILLAKDPVVCDVITALQKQGLANEPIAHILSYVLVPYDMRINDTSLVVTRGKKEYLLPTFTLLRPTFPPATPASSPEAPAANESQANP